MKLFTKFVASLFFVLLLCVAARAQGDWTGAYEFEEDGGKTPGGTAVFITHRLEVRETDDGYIAFLKSNGFQTSRDLICTAKIEGVKLLIYFADYGEDNVLESYNEGDLLLTLEMKTAKNKTEILTYWNKFQPVVPKNEKPGKVYFRKLEEIDEN